MVNKMELSKEYDTSSFVKDLQYYSLSLEKRQICQFLKYYELLVHWNTFVNLTAITEFSEVIKKHFIDSLSLVRYIDLSKVDTVIDVGTGAGFPGIPLKIAFPHLHITLLDSLQKRVSFLNEVIRELDLSEVETIHGRAEDFAKSDLFREKYDLCVSRAVANFSILSEYCIPFLKTGGSFVSYKSDKVSEEIESSGNAVKILGGSIKEKFEFVLPYTDISRTIVIVQKKKETPVKFPRKAGLPSKEPLH